MIFQIFIVLFFLILACFQDFKRREIDDWLNLLLFFSLSFYLILNSFANNSFSIFSFSFFIFFSFLVSVLLYYIRFFSGGDSRLLFALSPLFYNIFFMQSLINLGVFLIFLILAGALYGLAYILFFYSKNFKFVNKELKKKINFKIIILVSVIFIIFSFLDFIFLYFYILFLFCLFLLYVSKILENKIFTFYKSPNELTPGELLAEDVIFKNKKLIYTWEGLTEQDIKLLKIRNKKVLIKEGIPYAFAFLLAFLFYLFFYSI